MNDYLNYDHDGWRESAVFWDRSMKTKDRKKRFRRVFGMEVFHLFLVQIFMLCSMSIFILIGVSLHVVKLKRIYPNEYESHFNLGNETNDSLLQDLKLIEKSMGQMSFFRELKYNRDTNEDRDCNSNMGILVCGGTHKRGTRWSDEAINATQRVVDIVLGEHILIEFKRGLVFAVNNINEEHRNDCSKAQRGSFNQTNNSLPLFNLFLASSGYVSPCYMFGKRLYSYILGKNSGIWGYLMVTLPWFFSILSPQPLMLVHLPRLFIYFAIAIYRIFFLHLIINITEKKWSSFDFSDHIVLYAMYILIISIEWCAVGYNMKNRLLVSCIRGYCLSLLAIISYSSFFTALYFHFPLETFVGFIIAFLGLFVIFWLLVLLKYINLSKIGLLNYEID